MKPLTRRNALPVLAMFWGLAGVLLVASWVNRTHEKQMLNSPTCSHDEVFTSIECQATLRGTVIEISHEDVKLDVDGRRVSMPIQIDGDTSGSVGTPVQVRFYRGESVHVEGPSLNVDSTNSPTSGAFNFRMAGTAFLILGPLLVGVGLLSKRLIGPSKEAKEEGSRG